MERGTDVAAQIFVGLLQALVLCSLGCVKCVVFVFVYEGKYSFRELNSACVLFHLKTS